MLGLQHKIVLEDDQGQRHTLHLLEIVADQYFVLVPPDQAGELGRLRTSDGTIADAAVELLSAALSVVCVRDHRFLRPDELSCILRQSRHHILRLCGLRLECDLPPLARMKTPQLARAFAEECRLRERW